eukprot:3497484-Prymnesium_polylepis.1
MVVRMSCWALETCLTYAPRQRRRCSREKVDHHQPASCFIGARCRRRPYDQSCDPTFARIVLRFALIPGACAARGIKCVPQGPRRRVRRLDWPARDLTQNVEFCRSGVT